MTRLGGGMTRLGGRMTRLGGWMADPGGWMVSLGGWIRRAWPARWTSLGGTMARMRVSLLR